MKMRLKTKLKLYALAFICSLLVLLFLSNLALQLAQKPAEFLNLIGLGSAKTVQETWDDYADDFKKYSNGFVTPAYLAALAHVESSGNPFATPKWQLKLTTDITQIYSPSSSSVGLYQFTQSTFERANRYCIWGGKVIEDGDWHDPKSCWFQWLKTRLSASDSIEAASAYLQLSVTETLGASYSHHTVFAKQQLASVIHLCGESRGIEYYESNFSTAAIKNCGSHSLKAYLNSINTRLKAFQKLSERD